MNVNFQKLVIIIGVVLLSVVVISSTLICCALEVGDYKLEYKFFTAENYTISNISGNHLIYMPKFFTTGSPGDPMLPRKFYDIVLPPNANLSTVQLVIVKVDGTYLDGQYNIPPAPPHVTQKGDVSYGFGKKIANGYNIYVYSNDTLYPEKPIRIIHKGQLREVKIVRIEFTPFQYNPMEKRLFFNREVVFQILYSIDNRGANITSYTSNLIKEMSRSINVLNVEDIEQFVNIAENRYPIRNATVSESGIKNVAPPGTLDYVIITTNEIKNNSKELMNFVDYLEDRGFNVLIVTEDEYGSDQGQQRAINIRNWLIRNYQALGIKYVLLIGDPDPDDPLNPSDDFGDVPMMMCYPSRERGGYPTDYFYADLTGDWDTDSDGIYGEYNEDTGVDFYPEVFVGRIPVYSGDYDQLDDILRKIMNYGNTYGAWRTRVLLPMAISNYKNEHKFDEKDEVEEVLYLRTDGRELPKHIIEDILKPEGYTWYVLYERDGLSNVSADAPYFNAPLNSGNVISEWRRGYGMVFWWAHGSIDSAWRKIWEVDKDNDGIPDSSDYNKTINEINWVPFFTSQDTINLPNDRPSITYQCSCLNGYPEYGGNLGYALLKRGAIATVSASRVSWYTMGTWHPDKNPDNAEIGYEFVNRVVKDGLTVGEALYLAKSSLNFNDPYWWMNLMCFNLYGDPSITLEQEEIPVKVNKLLHGESALYVIPAGFSFGFSPTYISVKWSDSNSGINVTLLTKNKYLSQISELPTNIQNKKRFYATFFGLGNVYTLNITELGNPTNSTIYIVSNYQMYTLPTKLKINTINTFAGSASSPTQIEFEVEIYDGNSPFSFAPYSQPKPEELKNLFEVKIGGKLATILTVSGNGNKFRLTVAPPQQQSDGKYDLLVNFTFEKFGVSNTASALLDSAVEYGGGGETINVDVALVIDSSGSMASNDPYDLRKAASKYFVDLLSIGDGVAVVDFDSVVNVWKHLTNITSPAVKSEIKAAIDKVDSSGMTNIGGGLLYGYNELNSTQTGNRKAAILLTDGYHNTGTDPHDVVPMYKAKGWPIYTIALTGSADENLLKWIASETGGKYIKAEKAEDLLEIYNDLKRIVKKQTTVQKVIGKLSQNESVTQNVPIDSSIKSFEVSVSWSGSDLDLYLYYPNGTMVELNASSPTGTNDPNIIYVNASTYELYTVNSPIPGTWSYEIVAKQVVGEEDFTATVAATTEITLSASADKVEYYLTEPVTITATLTNMTGGIENASVIANITKPDGYVESLNLHDEGSGVYRIVYTNTSLPGDYSVEVKAKMSGITRVAEVEFEVLSAQSPINVTPKRLDFGLSYPGDEKSVTFTIEYKGTGTTTKSLAFENLLKELEISETRSQIMEGYLQALNAQSGLTGTIVVGDFIGNKNIINASNVGVSYPVISVPLGGKLNVTLTLNLPYDVEEDNYTSTVFIITNVGTETIDLNLSVQKLTKLAVVNQIKNDLGKWLVAKTNAEKMYYVNRIADKLLYWRYMEGDSE